MKMADLLRTCVICGMPSRLEDFPKVGAGRRHECNKCFYGRSEIQQPSTIKSKENGIEKRTCKKCGKSFPLDTFPSYGKGRRHECRTCYKSRMAQWWRDKNAGITKPKTDDKERECKQCGNVFLIEEFALVYTINSRGVNYRQHTCKNCAREIHAKRQRKARAENPEKYRAIQSKSWNKNKEKYNENKRIENKRIKDAAFNAYGGYKCACCGESEENMLNMDHIAEDGSIHRKEIGLVRGKSGGNSIYRWLAENDYPQGFQVLCYNCNISKHRNGGICSHKMH